MRLTSSGMRSARAMSPIPPDSRGCKPLFTMLANLPIFGVCGWSGSGKTTLIESVLPWLIGKNLKVAVVKHTSHALDIDQPGRDSDRFFQADADVCLEGNQTFIRQHFRAGSEITARILKLAPCYDLILIEGFKNFPWPKVWLSGETGDSPPVEISQVVATLSRQDDRSAQFMCLLEDWLAAQWLRVQVSGCILIGGRSSRMGRSKHLIEQDGITWLERTAAKLQLVTGELVIAGTGVIPGTLAAVPRLPDVPGLSGPLAGLLAAMRWNPWSSWLVAACDLPDFTNETLQWLLATRKPGNWATIPQTGRNHYEPLLAHYDFRARQFIEELAAGHELRLNRLTAFPSILTPEVPGRLLPGWRNVNTDADLHRV